MMRRALRYLLLGLAVLGLTAGLMLFHGQTTIEPTDEFSNIDRALSLYNRALEVKPSRMGAEGFTRIIRDRLDCYDAAESPMDRSRLCNLAYVDGIIRNARAHVQAMPELGLFIERVQFCPMVYSMCIGGTRSPEDCITLERQCIDAALDYYWRGTDNILRQ
ncbi:MAG: hypothetical protein AB7D57_07100 [Desulfovibrionaceae bacterium]